MRYVLFLSVLVFSVFSGVFLPGAEAVTVSVSADQPGAVIEPTFVGLFIEDINFNGDGGLYAELVKNRSFEFPDAMMGWSVIKKGDAEGSAVAIHKEDYKDADASCLRLYVDEEGDGFGVSNEGYRGMGIKQGETYYFSVYARTLENDDAMTLEIEVVNPDGAVLMEGQIEDVCGGWKHYECKMKAKATEAKAKLNLFVKDDDIIDLDMISLFPADSARELYGRKVPGLRQDLVDLLAAVKPGFLRFPGGCIVEGRTLDVRYQWKKTVGDLDERKTIINRWNTEFRHRLTPDYFQSFGLGFYEYFVLSETLGAEPMPIINCGMSCQFNTGQTVALDKIGPYVRDALDLIEFANGPVTSKWGKLRAEMGHPEPFGLKLLGVGNEQWGPQYIERWKIFEKALKEKYPEVKLIAGCGSDQTIFPNGPAEVKYLWSEYRKLKPDIVDEHFYRHYPWFFENTHYYDRYDPDGPEIFVGEYSAMSQGAGSPDNRNDLICALAEGAFLTGFERNAAVVTMSAYAPLAGHLDAWQWKPNLIWFDNLSAYGTPSYYVQQLFSLYKGDVVLPTKVAGSEERFYVTASLDQDSGQIIVKAINGGQETVSAAIELEIDGSKRIEHTATVVTLAGQPDDENSITEPMKIAPKESKEQILVSRSKIDYRFKPYSMTVLLIDVK